MIIELDLVERLSELHDWLVRQFCQIFKEREFHKKQCTILGNTFSPVRFPLGFPEQWAPWFVATKNLTTVCDRKLIWPWEFYAALKLILFWFDAASIRVQENPPSDSFHLLQFSVCYHTSNAAAAQCSQHQIWIRNLGKGNSLTLYIHLDDTACQTLQRRKIVLKTTSEMWVAPWWRTALDALSLSCLMISSYKVIKSFWSVNSPLILLKCPWVLGNLSFLVL